MVAGRSLWLFILIIGFTMSELVSAYPTSGGIYWWASKLGGPRAGFFTGWLNLIGLVAVTAGVSYGCATFIDLTISTYSERSPRTTRSAACSSSSWWCSRSPRC